MSSAVPGAEDVALDLERLRPLPLALIQLVPLADHRSDDAAVTGRALTGPVGRARQRRAILVDASGQVAKTIHEVAILPTVYPLPRDTVAIRFARTLG